ncbi:ABC transporter substrate-binding protein [Actinomadura sp. WMMA1423]|uniref:ABC transporter substrate-binding protein n=1 Tax=Actinomadura sp. WMMA1423 TaxID=2591108 RepID=UPI0011470758|nr:extracellular solute-binding protein [Actinomadura sp. WMMA1423]
MTRPNPALTSLALSASLLLAAGCGGAGSGGDRELLAAAWDIGQGKDPLDTAAAEFEKANPGVKVTVRKTPFAQYSETLRRQLSGNQVPDVARMLLGYGDAGNVLVLADKGLVADLSGSPWTDLVTPSGAAVSKKGDKTYALPVDSTSIGVFHDPETFEKRKLRVPETFADVLEMCRETAGSGTVAVAFGAQQGSAMARWLVFALAASTVFADNPRAGEQRLKGETTFAGTPGWRKAIERFKTMKDEGCFGKDATGVSLEAAARSLGQGKSLMAIAPTATMPLFMAGDPKARLAMFAFPGGDDPAAVRVPSAPASGLAVPRKAAHRELARRFLDFYAENRVRYSKIDDSAPGIPASKDDPGVPAYATALTPFLTSGRTAPIMDQTWLNPEVDTRLDSGTANLLLGKETPEGVLKGMDEAWTPTAP